MEKVRTEAHIEGIEESYEILESTDDCINCKFCTWKYDMYLCTRENMPEPTSSNSWCAQFIKKGEL